MTTETPVLNFHSTRSKPANHTGKRKMRSTTRSKPFAREKFLHSIDLPPDGGPSLEEDSCEPTNIFSVVRHQSKTEFSPSDPSLITTTINNVAVAYRAMGLYEEAKRLLEYGVQSFRRYNFSGRLELAVIMDNLAAVYSDLDRFELAEKIGRRALHIRQVELGPEDDGVAVSLDNLGLICAQQGKYQEAKFLHKRALSIFKKKQQGSSLDMATCHNNLATLYFNLGNNAEAKRHYIRAIAIALKASSDKVPELGIYYNNLAELYRDEGDLSNARFLFQKGFTILERCYGPNHPETFLVRQNLEDLSLEAPTAN